MGNGKTKHQPLLKKNIPLDEGLLPALQSHKKGENVQTLHSTGLHQCGLIWKLLTNIPRFYVYFHILFRTSRAALTKISQCLLYVRMTSGSSLNPFWPFHTVSIRFSTDRTCQTSPTSISISLHFSCSFHFFSSACWLPGSSSTKLCSIISTA